MIDFRVRKTLVVDIECYVDYFLVMFRRVDTGVTRVYEMYAGHTLDTTQVRQIMATYRTVSFNGLNYDLPMLTLALRGASCAELKKASDTIINSKLRGWQFEQLYDLKIDQKWDHIDLIEVAFGQGSLKLYGGRLHSKRLQDLPIDPSARISPEQREQLVAYCGNDLTTTIDLWNHLLPQIELRERMSIDHGVDLRSKSDAQIAEAVIRKGVSKIIGEKVQKPSIPPGTSFKYEPPTWLSYSTGPLQNVLADVCSATFYVAADAGVTMPDVLNGRSVAIGNSVYRMGIGGLHSSEQNQSIVADADHVLIDRDVTSYYPAIILGSRLSPLHLRENDAFLRVYKDIVDRRVHAKRNGETTVANALKIVANGSFGKFGSKYSALYSPHLMIQVTLTGQLALLMLIERLEARGIRVVSGNTDGIVIHCRKTQEPTLTAVIAEWEKATGFNTEETRYRAIFSRDVNNYVAMKEGGGAKGKGAFAGVSIAKNPQNVICIDAVLANLKDGTPIETTIRACTDIRKFVTVRTVRGGGVQMLSTRYDDNLTPGQKRAHLISQGWRVSTSGPLATLRLAAPGTLDTMGENGRDVETAYRMHCGEDAVRYLGKVVRFYIGHSSVGAIYYNEKNKSGGRNKVPASDGAVPVMELPDTLPSDIDYDFYIREANSILADIGVSAEKRMQLMYGEAAELF